MLMKKNIIRITSRLGTEFDSEVVIGKETYLVQTENSGAKKPLIITRVYLKGQIVLSRKTDYGDITDVLGSQDKLRELMRKQHKLVTEMIKAEKLKKTKSISDYLEDVKDLLRIKNNKKALRVLNEALEKHPDDPFLLSYYGCLQAVTNKDYDTGIDVCHTAIDSLKKRVPFGEEFFYPVFYLNLGRAYLASGNKAEAVNAFNLGLEAGGENKDLLWEIRKLGLRRTPAVPFLRRSNPINKYIGQLLHSLKK